MICNTPRSTTAVGADPTEVTLGIETDVIVKDGVLPTLVIFGIDVGVTVNDGKVFCVNVGEPSKTVKVACLLFKA